MNEDTPQNRRGFLKKAGSVAGVGLVAGCLGEDTDSPNDTEDPGAEDRDTETPDAESSDSDFPDRDVTMIIPFGPGGGYDAQVRLMAPYLEKHLPTDVSVRVQNIEGAGGQIGVEQAYNDNEYSMVLMGVISFSVLQHIQDAEFDMAEMIPYAQVAEDRFCIDVGSNTDIKSWDDYVSAVQNDELRFYASSLTGTVTIVPVALGEVSGLYSAENVLDNQVFYDGRGEGIQGIMSGDIEVMPGPIETNMPYYESGELRSIMYTSLDEELPEEIPDADTLVTADVPNREEVHSLAGGDTRYLMGPPGVSDEQAEVYREALDRVFDDDEFLADVEEAGQHLTYAPGDTAEQDIEDTMNTWEDNERILDLLVEYS